VLENPIRGFFGETALPSASNNDGNDSHTVTPAVSKCDLH
jgi:hypothetical protein